MAIPLRSPCNYSVLAGDSSSGSDRGITHFFMATRNTTEGVGEKEQRTKKKRTMWALVNSKCKKGGSVTLHSMCICRLTLACISSEISSKPRGMPTHPDWPSLTASFCWPLSTALLRHSSPTAFSEFLFPTPWLAFPCPLPIASRSQDQTFVWLRAKTNKKIVCLAHPLHSVIELSNVDSNYRKKAANLLYIFWKFSFYCLNINDKIYTDYHNNFRRFKF